MANDPYNDPYTVLGVDPGADLTEIRRTYLARLRASHPDLRPGDAAAEERTRDLNRAWEQVRARRAATVRSAAVQHLRTPPPTHRPHRPHRRAYSAHRRDIRTAFTAATLRVALAIVALGLLLLAVLH